VTATVGATLEREHRTIDDGIMDFAGTDPSAVAPEQRSALLDSIAVLRRHIYIEEQYLFPPLRAAGMVGPVMVMVREHGLMWPLLDQLERLVSDGDFGTATQLCRDLLQQLNSHNTKEEMILYPQADEVLSPGDLDELTDLLSTAEIPADWVCGGVLRS
jgi:iron-sulfur cluster repair protein YtfE (RIC family)